MILHAGRHGYRRPRALDNPETMARAVAALALRGASQPEIMAALGIEKHMAQAAARRARDRGWLAYGHGPGGYTPGERADEITADDLKHAHAR